MSTPPPGLDFLALPGTPDPRTPRAPEPEAQLPFQAYMPESPGVPEVSGVPDFLGLPEKPGTPESGGLNFPGAENLGSEVQNAISILASHNIQTVMPGGMAPAPNQEMDPDFRALPSAYQCFLRVLEKSGRVTKAAEVSGVARGVAYRWKRDNEIFSKLWDRALKYRSELLEDEAIRRAVQGVKKNVYYMGAVCGTETVYSDALLSKLLEGNMPQKYRQNHKVELEGNVGVATLVLPATTSAEEWAAQNAGTIIDVEPEDINL